MNRLAIDFSGGDINSFYTNVCLDVLGSLVSTIYLQDHGPGTDSFLDPESDALLSLYIFLTERYFEIF